MGAKERIRNCQTANHIDREYNSSLHVAMKNEQLLPREKLNARGAASLTDAELLQAVIGSGGKGNDYRQIAKNLAAAIEKIGADNLTIDDVKSIKGIGEAKATTVFAALEFWRRKFTKQTAPLIDSPDRAAEQLESIRNKKQEHFIVLTLNGARRLINKHVITVGTLTSSLVHPREVFSQAIEDRAASIIIAHNHPSGMLDISEQDREVSRRIKEAGEILGIGLDDHIIVTSEGFVSAL
jgi:DNA repair protein RadC